MGGPGGVAIAQSIGWLVPFLCSKAVLACINISSMRQMFFQMQELPQLWRVSRVDFVRNTALLSPAFPAPPASALNQS